MTEFTQEDTPETWIRTHYVADTNFLLNYPNLSVKQGFTDRFQWGAEPFVLVVCDVVLAELDRLKTSGDEQKRYRVRQAVRSIESVLEDNRIIHSFGHLVVFGESRTRRGDMNLLERAKQYAETVPDERVVLLTDDILFRIRCKGESFDCVDPEKLEERINRRHDEDYGLRQEIREGAKELPELEVLDKKIIELYKMLNVLGMAYAPMEEIRKTYQEIESLFQQAEPLLAEASVIKGRKAEEAKKKEAEQAKQDNEKQLASDPDLLVDGSGTTSLTGNSGEVDDIKSRFVSLNPGQRILVIVAAFVFGTVLAMRICIGFFMMMLVGAM